MRNLLFFLLGLAVTLLLAVPASRTAQAAPFARCNARLTVELTPDVPDASDAGFLSSLLNNHPDYRLELLRKDDPSLIEVDLSGPGPSYVCEEVINTMRKDARVLSVRVNRGETPVATTTGIAPISSDELWGVQVSSAAIGSLYWAAHHPGKAWRVLLPVQPDEAPGGERLKETRAVRPVQG
jgi:hypothetical protein